MRSEIRKKLPGRTAHLDKDKRAEETTGTAVMNAIAMEGVFFLCRS